MYTISIDHFSATIEFFVTKKVKIYFIFAKFQNLTKWILPLTHYVFKEEFNLNSSQLHNMKWNIFNRIRIHEFGNVYINPVISV